MKKLSLIFFAMLISFAIILDACKKNEEEPVAAFTADQTTIAAGGTVNFTDQSTNSPTSWLWNFGDDEISSSQNPSHTYNTAKKYTVSLKVSNSSGSNTEIKTDYITIAFTDPRDGQVYEIVEIGSQTWMAENLRATRFADGTSIPKVEGITEWQNLSYADKAYCWYTNDSATNATTYGALYTWASAMNGENSRFANSGGVQGVCPTGWHLPSDSEWKQLEMYLGMSHADADDIGFRGSNEGGKMKEIGTTHWNSPNSGATNESGFTALPGGKRDCGGNFTNMGLNTFFWSSTDNNFLVWNRALNHDYESVYRYYINRDNGFSVRCVRD